MIYPIAAACTECTGGHGGRKGVIRGQDSILARKPHPNMENDHVSDIVIAQPARISGQLRSPRCRSARPDRFGPCADRWHEAGTVRRDQAGNEHVLRRPEADRCRRPECGLCGSRSGRWSCGDPPARLALRHLQLCRRRAVAGVGRLPRDHPVPARLRHDALYLQRHRPQRPAVSARGRCHRLDGCAQDREGDRRRFRLGRTERGYRRGAVAGALQGPGRRERLSDRQPGSRPDAVAAGGRAAMVVPVLFCHGTRPRRLRQVPARVFEAHLAARFAEMGFR